MSLKLTGLLPDITCFTYFINNLLIICKVKNFIVMNTEKSGEKVLILVVYFWAIFFGLFIS